MNIVVISRSWPSDDRSGVSLSAAAHVKVLNDLGHVVSIFGSSPQVVQEDLPVAHKVYIQSSGSGSLYSPALVDELALNVELRNINPDLVIIEGWQTALTDCSIDAAFNLKIPILMISHGISLHPFKNNFLSIIRSLGWLPYWYIKLPRMIKKVSVLTTLDMHSISNRFYDRKLAVKLGKKILCLINTPINWHQGHNNFFDRKKQMLVIGYFSSIKNQKYAIELMKKIDSDISLCFIGKKRGDYYEKCKKLASEEHFLGRLRFLEDDECNIANEIANSKLVLSTSVTEVLPLTLLEAMASGTPYVASAVGAVPMLGGGVSLGFSDSWISEIESFFFNKEKWELYSKEGRECFKSRYSYSELSKQLEAAIEMVFSKKRKCNDSGLYLSE